ncbi:MAG: TnpV protein [Ruminococcus sp.]|nr:TnpV protein [Ruminococcus sp.]
MSKQKNYEVIGENELGYLKVGDYFIPDLKLPQENRSIGKYGRMHRDYLQEHNPIRFDDLVLEGKLWTYLADLNEQAQNRLQLIIMQMQEAECVNDELKENNQMAWVQAMNSIHNRAEEIVLHELVYGEDA